MTDENYILVNDLQRITDEYVMSANLSLTPKPIWRRYIESVFKETISLDLDKKDKILVGNIEFLKDSALILAALDELELGMNVSGLLIIHVNYRQSLIVLLILEFTFFLIAS